MAHSFSHAQSTSRLALTASGRNFYHAASDTHFEMLRKDGQFIQRRWQTALGGQQIYVQELSVDEVIGSGNHAQTFLHREQDGTLVELPLGWYAEDGGHFGMSPGFDNPKPVAQHMIAYECMFCHNAYPNIPPMPNRDSVAFPSYAGELPQGVDCQRCHGPGQAHVQAAREPGTSLELVRSSILNPAKLSADRQMEVCDQCHLETTSRHLPDRIRHYGRAPFSYRAGEPLSTFISYFDRDPALTKPDSFEIVSAPYRLRQSKCFRATAGALTCETCHNPHDLRRGADAISYYANICLSCHSKDLPSQVSAGAHPASNQCVACHMPKRRTDDVVHVVMTDHLIQRPSATSSELLRQRAEILETPGTSYHGEVLPYPNAKALPSPQDALYLATAQVMQGSNTVAGIARLKQLLQESRPEQPDFSTELGDAMRRSGDLDQAIGAYQQALAIDPQSARARRSLGVALGEVGQPEQAASVLIEAIAEEPSDPLPWYELSRIRHQQGEANEALKDIRQALLLKPDLAPAQNNLGIMLAVRGNLKDAQTAFEAALVINPYDPSAQANLARTLAAQSDLLGAAFYFRKAVSLDPSNVELRNSYAETLMALGRTKKAQTQMVYAKKPHAEGGKENR